MKRISLLLAIALLSMFYVSALAQQINLTDQISNVFLFNGTPDFGLQTEMYKCDYNNKITHSVSYGNLDDAKIAAIEIIFIEFNIFKEYMGITRGVLYPGVQSRVFSRETSDYSFHRGILIVTKVRFRSGDLWTPTSFRKNLAGFLEIHTKTNKTNILLIDRIIEDINKN